MESLRGTPYPCVHNAGLISKFFKDTASDNTENCCFRQLHCRLMLRLQGTPGNICINFILPETRGTGLRFCCWKCGSIFIRIFGGLRNRMYFANRVHNGRSRSSKVVDFGINRKRVCNVILVIIFKFSADFLRLHTYSTQILGVFPFN